MVSKLSVASPENMLPREAPPSESSPRPGGKVLFYRQGILRVAGHDYSLFIPVPPAVGRDFVVISQQDAGLHGPGLAGKVGLPARDAVRAFIQPAFQIGHKAFIDGTAQDLLPQTIDLEEYESRDVCSDGVFILPCHPLGHQPVESGILIQRKDRAQHRIDHGKPDRNPDTRHPIVDGDTRYPVDHHEYCDPA